MNECIEFKYNDNLKAKYLEEVLGIDGGVIVAIKDAIYRCAMPIDYESLVKIKDIPQYVIILVDAIEDIYRDLSTCEQFKGIRDIIVPLIKNSDLLLFSDYLYFVGRASVIYYLTTQLRYVKSTIEELQKNKNKDTELIEVFERKEKILEKALEYLVS